MRLFDFFGAKLEYKTVSARCRKRTFKLQVADSFRKLSVGLMNHDGLAKNGGMLFVFSSDSRPGIWMLNMKFSIDIIWLDSEKKIVHIVEDAKPCKSIFSCRTEKPPKGSRYVVELYAGTAKSAKFRLGDKFTFSL